MEISYLPSDYLIKTIKKSEPGGSDEDIFILRALKIKNNQEVIAAITELQLDLKSDGESQKLISYPKKILSNRFQGAAKMLDFFGNLEEQRRTFEFQNFLGQDPFWDIEKFTANTELHPLEETGFTVEVFKGYFDNPVDELELRVKFEASGESRLNSISIPIITYSSKNEYILPLKGEWLVWGTWDVTTASHRIAHSQEFGMDFIQLNDDLMFPITAETKNEEFKSYGKEIYAVGDGEVVDVFDSTPENPAAPEMLPQETQEELSKKYGRRAIALGNYVIIRHPGDEYSCYVHLLTESALVKKGDKVSQGQVIGKVGNAGRSAAPHLHFQIMDGPNFLTARGLPCHFTNIADFLGKKVTLIQDNLTIVHVVEN